MRTTRSTTVTAFTTLGVVAALALTLTGCAGGAGNAGGASSESPRPTATDTAASPSPADPSPADPSPSTAAPVPSPEPEPAVASIPTDCTDIVDAATYASTMADTPLNDPEFFVETPMGQLEPIAPPAGADPYTIVESGAQLRCGWRDIRADITGLFVDVATVDAATAAAYPAWLADPAVEHDRLDDGAVFDCTDRLGGSVCQLTRVEEQYGTTFTQTVLVRDDVVVTVHQSNYPTNDLLGAIVTRIWG